MSNNIFMRGGIGGSAGMLVHEATKNFEMGRRSRKAADGVPPAGHWSRRVFADAFAREPVPYAPRGESGDRASYLDTFFRRRSIRAYAPEPLAFDALGEFLGLAYPDEVRAEGYVAALQPHQSLGHWNGHVTACRLVLLANRVEGLAAGAYLVDECESSLRRVDDRDPAALQALLRAGCFQQEFHTAPALFLQIGSIHDAIVRYGERGYRYMLLENGVLLQRMYLAASSLGLAGCVTGSVIQKEFEQWLGLDGYTGALINCFALGHMPSMPQTGAGTP